MILICLKISFDDVTNYHFNLSQFPGSYFENLEMMQSSVLISKHYFRFSKLRNDFFRLYTKTA